MPDTFDTDTGELHEPASVRAANSVARARVQMDRDRNGHGAISLHFGVFEAVKQMPIWIKAEKSGGKGKYAPLKDILAVARPLLAVQGIRIRQGAEKSWGMDEGGGTKGRLVPVYTDLIDVRTGEYERTQVEIPLARADAQSMGSAITYGKRYSLLAALGLASDEADDDGEAAMPRDLNARAKASPDCEAMLQEIAEIKKLDALTKWGSDPKNRKRLDHLNDVDTERVRTAYGDAREKLSVAE